MPRRKPKALQMFLIIFSAILVVAVLISLAVIFPSSVFWKLIVDGVTLAQQFFVMLSAFFAWLIGS